MRDKAIAEYKKALSINPTYVKAYSNLGITYGELKRAEESIETLKNALALKPDDPEIHSNLAASYYLQGDYTQARFHCDKALALGYRVNPKLLELLKTSP
jgi:Flp pilus assembly protein TadD